LPKLQNLTMSPITAAVEFAWQPWNVTDVFSFSVFYYFWKT
jgi:hypothetical protein